VGLPVARIVAEEGAGAEEEARVSREALRALTLAPGRPAGAGAGAAGAAAFLGEAAAATGWGDRAPRGESGDESGLSAAERRRRRKKLRRRRKGRGGAGGEAEGGDDSEAEGEGGDGDVGAEEMREATARLESARGLGACAAALAAAEEVLLRLSRAGGRGSGVGGLVSALEDEHGRVSALAAAELTQGTVHTAAKRAWARHAGWVRAGAAGPQ